MMVKFNFWSCLLLGAGLMSLASCTSDDESVNNGVPVGGDRAAWTFEVGADGSRTTLGDDNRVLFCDGDSISVFNNADSNNDPFTTKIDDEPVETAKFNGYSNVGAQHFAILYPYRSDATCTKCEKDSATIKATVPATQTAVENNYDPKANVSVAVTEAEPSFVPKFYMKNIVGLLKFMVGGSTDYKKVVIRGKNGEKITGAVTVTVKKDSRPDYDKGDAAEITLEGDIKAGSVYYVAILPDSTDAEKNEKMVTFSQGIVMDFYDDTDADYPVGTDTVFNRSTKEGPVITRSKILNVGTVTPKKAFTVTFDLNGHGATQPMPQTVVSGSKVSKPAPAPADEVYTLCGWYTDASCTHNWDFAHDVVTSDTTLFARWIEGAIPGEFTVADPDGVPDSGDETKVMFSKGNLWCVKTDGAKEWSADSCEWKFADNQWDTFETAGMVIEGNYANHDTITLFGWGTSGYNHGATCYQPWDTRDDMKGYYVYGWTFRHLYEETGQADWGYNAISNGGNTENCGWRTLTYNQWDYLFNFRTDAGEKYGYATVENVHGIIMLPDDFTDPKKQGREGKADFVPQSKLTGWEANEYSAGNWQTMQTAGAVFLPAAGYRRKGTEISDVGSYGYYWSSNYAQYYTAYPLYFRDNYIYKDYQSVFTRYLGLPVRLVMECK